MTNETTLTEYIGQNEQHKTVAAESGIEESEDDTSTSETMISAVVERAEKERVAGEIEEWVDEARDLATEIGLEPYHVNYWIVNNEEMNKLITYEGFQTRYPHWRWGMEYDRQRKQDEHLPGKAFEIVNNDNPAHAFLQLSNSEIDQKAVVTHVEAHADFFANNRWFRDSPDAAQMLSRHAERIDGYMSDPDISRDDVESLIDTIICLRDHIDQTKTLLEADPIQVDESREESEEELSSLEERIRDLEMSDSIREQFFGEDWIEEAEEDDDRRFYNDILAYIRRHGGRFDEEEEEAVEFEEWESEVIRMLREEQYYFAPQMMTKIMNEGHASYWETIMMAHENFADDDEFIEYSDHHARVLASPGLNPYKFGREMWMHIENTENRREVVDKLLRVQGVTPQNFTETIDFERVRELLDTPDSYSPAKRHYSLVRKENRGFIERISYDELQEIGRYIVDDERYETIDEAIEDVDYDAGWERMLEVRETHIDVTFIDEFLDEEFVEERNYFTWDENPRNERPEVSSLDPEDVKRKLLLQFTNFGKPTIVVEDGNYNNRRELLLTHKYNGIPLDLRQAGDVIERMAEDVWGRPVHLRTVDRERDGTEIGVQVWYDPSEHDEPHITKCDEEGIDWEYLIPDEIDSYYTKPKEWFQ